MGAPLRDPHRLRRVEGEERVRRCYSTWASTYYDEYYGLGSPYPPIHRDLLLRTLRESGALTVLDAGCGPASFMRHLVRDGYDAYGFDLVPEMVAEARRVLGDRADRVWEGSVTDPCAYARGPRRTYDAATCVGVLPHLEEGSEAAVFRNLHGAVRDGGVVAVEARNQLFALFTLNRYTFELFRDELVRPGDGEDADAIGAALDGIRGHLRMDLPPLRTGKEGEPGYDEVRSRTHNPIVLRDAFAAAGFRDVRTLFYHFHRLPPMLEAAAPERYRRWSLAVEDPNDWRGHFMASAFILVGTRS